MLSLYPICVTYIENLQPCDLFRSELRRSCDFSGIHAGQEHVYVHIGAVIAGTLSQMISGMDLPFCPSFSWLAKRTA